MFRFLFVQQDTIRAVFKESRSCFLLESRGIFDVRGVEALLTTR